jgi:hypothetical protein
LKNSFANWNSVAFNRILAEALFMYDPPLMNTQEFFAESQLENEEENKEENEKEDEEEDILCDNSDNQEISCSESDNRDSRIIPEIRKNR